MSTKYRMVRLKIETIFLLETECSRMMRLRDFQPMAANFKQRFSFDDVVQFLIGEKHRHRQRARKQHRKQRDAKSRPQKG